MPWGVGSLSGLLLDSLKAHGLQDLSYSWLHRVLGPTLASAPLLRGPSPPVPPYPTPPSPAACQVNAAELGWLPGHTAVAVAASFYQWDQQGVCWE